MLISCCYRFSRLSLISYMYFMNSIKFEIYNAWIHFSFNCHELSSNSWCRSLLPNGSRRCYCISQFMVLFLVCHPGAKWFCFWIVRWTAHSPPFYVKCLMIEHWLILSCLFEKILCYNHRMFYMEDVHVRVFVDYSCDQRQFMKSSWISQMKKNI